MTRTRAYANHAENGRVSGCRPMSSKCPDLGRPFTGGHPLTPFGCLGVKWSQVQILSAQTLSTRHCQLDQTTSRFLAAFDWPPYSPSPTGSEPVCRKPLPDA
jgi:hypothetical protein